MNFNTTNLQGMGGDHLVYRIKDLVIWFNVFLIVKIDLSKTDTKRNYQPT